ncbi:MAG: mannose-1-phosphate guanylyltransferase/mannose-6-phosphate isomerase [Bdellovibrionaceae bacterium]|nr:mannose-1-phosphate guanylyltransferase/mannose-6-phosphate isomerase [Pseudobdellovibrionaceae bacterium]|tara:strand:+ start:103215 stop:104615 length:1401 start_codon:yes stop_codon:yes gene_type:complete
MIPVILSGGSGTRLWPVSRENYPKQFCDLYDDSFLGNTISRLQNLDNPWVVTVKSMEALTYRSLKEANVPTDNVLYEPFGKNTAPAVALMCHVFSQRGQSDEVIGFFPADHLVFDQDRFLQAVSLAEEAAQKGHVVTLGIQPTYASTGYGYIEVTDNVVSENSDGLKAFKAQKFYEKPDVETANRFIEEGQFYWNSGMFVFKVSTMIEHMQKHLPEVWEKISGVDKDLSNLKYQYANVESISIDYGIMEKLDECVCIPCDMGWSDVGSWDEISRLSEEVPSLKVGSGASVLGIDSNNNYVFSVGEKIVGLIDVADLIVVDTPDALLVSQKHSTQKVKDLVKDMKQQGMRAAIEHRFEKRHWGGYEILSDDDDYKAKKITVDPGAQLSYQSHAKRQEHWVVISGKAEVVLDGESNSLGPGESIMIPVGAKHRMRNPGTEPVVFVEVQTGTYFGEDDIVRYEDDYNRA